MVHITLPMQHSPSPLTAFTAGSLQPSLTRSAAENSGVHCLFSFSTPPLPVMPVRVGDGQSYARSQHRSPLRSTGVTRYRRVCRFLEWIQAVLRLLRHRLSVAAGSADHASCFRFCG